MIRQRWWVLLVLCLIFFRGYRAQAQILERPENRVLIVVNTNSADSVAVGDYYRQRRSIPAINVCRIACPNGAIDYNSERIANTLFQQQIRTPILDYIAHNHLKIDYIVLTRGIPKVVQGDTTGPPVRSGSLAIASVDSLMAVSRGYPEQPDLIIENTDGSWWFASWQNRYWNATERFSSERNAGFIVTRLDGYTRASALALVDRGMQAHVLRGTWLFDVNPRYGYSDHVQPRSLTDADYGLYLSDYNTEMITAANMLRADGIPGVLLENTEAFQGNITDVAGYISWGSNDHQWTRPVYNSLRFVPGALADTAMSSSGRTFVDPNWDWRSLIVDLVDQGVTGCRGYVWEPYLDGVSSPTVLFDHYTRGFNLGESFLAAARFIGWQEVVLGDPLTRIKPWRDKRGTGR